jgi:hypothetical protein
MTFQQILAQAKAMNPEVTSLHVEATLYADGEDSFLRYELHVPGDRIFGDTADDLLANVLETRKAA